MALSPGSNHEDSRDMDRDPDKARDNRPSMFIKRFISTKSCLRKPSLGGSIIVTSTDSPKNCAWTIETKCDAIQLEVRLESSKIFINFIHLLLCKNVFQAVTIKFT